MQIYTYLFLDPRNVIQGFEFDQCDSDDEARRRASDMLRARPERRSVEIWNDTFRVAVVG